MTDIHTERLTLTSWSADYFPCVEEIYADEDNARYIGGQKPAWQAWRQLAAIIGHRSLRGYTLFAVIENRSQRAIGWCGPWYPYDWPEPELSYSLTAAAHGRGYATEACSAALKWIYTELRWDTAISLIDAENSASQNVVRKLGAVRENKTRVSGDYDVDVWRHLPRQEFLRRL